MALTIIEGPDCSGKTTLLKQGFKPKDGWVHEHFGPPGPHQGPWQQYSNCLFRAFHTPSFNVAFDRFLYGELVYGPLLRPTTASLFTLAHARMLERVLLSLETVLIAAQTDKETTLQLWQERQESELIKDSDKLHSTWQRFRWLFTDPDAIAVPVVHYDFQQARLTRLLQEVEAARPPKNQGPGIGMFQPGVTLMIGEQVNENQAVAERWPFVANGGSSLWLAQQLQAARVSERELYWVNALDTKGQELDPDFVAVLRPSRVIALGKAAELWAKRHLVSTLPTYFVPHPAFWKRFHSHEVYPLVQLFRELQGMPLVPALFDQGRV